MYFYFSLSRLSLADRGTQVTAAEQETIPSVSEAEAARRGLGCRGKGRQPLRHASFPLIADTKARFFGEDLMTYPVAPSVRRDCFGKEKFPHLEALVSNPFTVVMFY